MFAVYSRLSGDDELQSYLFLRYCKIFEIFHTQQKKKKNQKALK